MCGEASYNMSDGMGAISSFRSDGTHRNDIYRNRSKLYDGPT